ncbi:hypothetical protein BDQ17DRAFT_1328318 [Cyathus striatus]|nr:hypothetical protein BDQ17DRAFT_1328318 [Cyathus striatus]
MASLAAKNIASAATLKSANPVAIFVGGTSGVGQGMAEAFNQHTKGNPISSWLAAADEESSGSYNFVPCDISLTAEAKRTAAELTNKYPKVNFLVITAGVLGATKSTTTEGLDKQSAVHYYGRWSFIHELLPSLRAAQEAKEDAKVMSVYGPGQGRGDMAVNSNDMMCEEYALRNPGVVFAHAHPGNVRTNVLKKSDSKVMNAMSHVMPLFTPFTVSQEECAEYLWSGLYRVTPEGSSGDIPGAYRITSKGEDLGMKHYYGSPEQRKTVWKETTDATKTDDP